MINFRDFVNESAVNVRFVDKYFNNNKVFFTKKGFIKTLGEISNEDVCFELSFDGASLDVFSLKEKTLITCERATLKAFVLKNNNVSQNEIELNQALLKGLIKFKNSNKLEEKPKEYEDKIGGLHFYKFLKELLPNALLAFSESSNKEYKEFLLQKIHEDYKDFVDGWNLHIKEKLQTQKDAKIVPICNLVITFDKECKD